MDSNCRQIRAFTSLKTHQKKSLDLLLVAFDKKSHQNGFKSLYLARKWPGWEHCCTASLPHFAAGHAPLCSHWLQVFLRHRELTGYFLFSRYRFQLLTQSTARRASLGCSNPTTQSCQAYKHEIRKGRVHEAEDTQIQPLKTEFLRHVCGFNCS